MRIPLSLARGIVLRRQLLDGQDEHPTGPEGAARVVERLGYVQIDTISVIERAHHHVLWSRCPDYRPAALQELQGVERRVFEGWAHAASFLPMADYRFHLARMRRYRDSQRAREWREANAAVVEEVLGRIRAEGPLGSQAFEPPPGWKRGAWWHWKPAKHALEHLLSTGELMVRERRGFQRVYDLAERVVPPGTDTSAPAAEEMERWEARRALTAFGLAAPGDRPWGRGRGGAKEGMQDLVAAGEAVRVEVEGLPDPDLHVLREDLEAASRNGDVPLRAHLLSPFDNLVIRRWRVKQLWGFDYRMEAYTPEAKRRYGYFPLPILWDSQLVGRLDPKADRKARTLIVKSLHLEPDAGDLADFWPALAATLRDFATFNGCDSVALDEGVPQEAREALGMG